MYVIERNCFGESYILKGDNLKFTDKKKAENYCDRLNNENKYIVYNVVTIKD